MMVHCTSIAGGTGSILGGGSFACHIVWQKKKGRTHTCSLHFVSEGTASLLSSAHWPEPVASPKCRGWDVQRSTWNVWKVILSLFYLVLQHNAGLDASR